jgi:hypothetical protein
MKKLTFDFPKQPIQFKDVWEQANKPLTPAEKEALLARAAKQKKQQQR